MPRKKRELDADMTTEDDGEVLVADDILDEMGTLIIDTSDEEETDALMSPQPGRVYTPAERRKLSLAMRLAGATFKTISEHFGVDIGTSTKDVRMELEALGSDDMKTLRSVYHARLEQLLSTRWPKALKGDDSALASCLAILDRVERLYGINGLPDGHQDESTKAGNIIILAGDTSHVRAELNAAKKQQSRSA